MDIEIDPKLFITCRLCMDSGGSGMFQIVPTVQDQIKYCFDIDVNPFDGLPQLICKACRAVLNNFFAKKKEFKDNQDSLKTSLSTKVEEAIKDNAKVSEEHPQQSLNSPSNSEDKQLTENIYEPDPFKPQAKKRKHNLFSSSSSEGTPHNSRCASKNVKKKRKTIKNPCSDKYNLLYKCKFCSVEVVNNRGSLFSHVRNKHKTLLQNYKKIISQQCKVTLHKIDSKLNKTGFTDTVMISKKKIFKDSQHPYYSIKLIRKQNKTDNFAETSSDEHIFDSLPANRLRILSRSSNETVVLENPTKSVDTSESEQETTNKVIQSNNCITECINIDDSSNDSSVAALLSDQNIPDQADSAHYTSIQNLIAIWYKKHCKKNYSDSRKQSNSLKNESYTQLKHKILSIGRKVIHKQGISSTGIIRYLENKNLKINWIQSGNDSLVRINTREIGKEKSKNEEWQDVEQDNFEEFRQLHFDKANWTEKSSQNFYIGVDDLCSKNVILNASPVANPKQLPKKTIFLENNAVAIKTSKNAKSNLSLSKKKTNTKRETKNINADEDSLENETMCLPIITSTTSLAPNQPEVTDNNKNKTERTTDRNNYEAAPPRIKVKSVSELMGNGSVRMKDPYPHLLNYVHERSSVTGNVMGSDNSQKQNPDVSNILILEVNPMFATNNIVPSNSMVTVSYSSQQMDDLHQGRSQPQSLISTPQPDLPFQQPMMQTAMSQHHHLSSTSPSASHLLQPITNQNANQGPSMSFNISNNTANTDYVLLDTVELPNTKTKSPHKYLKNLLQIHGLDLHDNSDALETNFICLVKFKLQVQQVVLALSLLCSNVNYCLLIRDKNNQLININKLNANWQWEILKTCTGNVADRLLSNAQKYGHSVYENTKKFVCLLRSIKFKLKTF